LSQPVVIWSTGQLLNQSWSTGQLANWPTGHLIDLVVCSTGQLVNQLVMVNW